MAIQGTDLLLINRGGTSFHVKHEDIATKVDDDDLALVNSGGVSYKLPGARLKAGTFGDNDLFLVNRGGESFKCPGSEVKSGLAGLPEILTAVISRGTDSPSGDPATVFEIDLTFDGPVPADAVLKGVFRVNARPGDGSGTMPGLWFSQIVDTPAGGLLPGVANSAKIVQVQKGSSQPQLTFSNAPGADDGKLSIVFANKTRLQSDGSTDNLNTNTAFGSSDVRLELLQLFDSNGNKSGLFSSTNEIRVNNWASS